MWSVEYKGYYIQGNCGQDSPVVALQSKTGMGYEWRTVCKSYRAAQIAITKHIKKQQEKQK